MNFNFKNKNNYIYKLFFLIFLLMVNSFPMKRIRFYIRIYR